MLTMPITGYRVFTAHLSPQIGPIVHIPLGNTITTSTLQPYFVTLATPWQRLTTEKWKVVNLVYSKPSHPQIGDKLAEICKTHTVINGLV